jgi:DNA mismatch repair protein MutS2
MPVLNTQGEWKLRKARHPMIPRERAQPIDLELGHEWLGVLITGPNTGGKTVSLKTLGLLTLMTLLGCTSPRWRGRASPSRTASTPTSATNRACSSRCPPFQGTCGTSSATWRRQGRYSLVLLDELGAGTDPTEGAALARAILQTLLEREARVVATTHYGELKAFAHRHPQLINAAMEFDLETLQPTYRLLMGAPGASHAIEIARRLGLPERVAQQATESLGVQEATLTEMIQDLERARRHAEQAEAEWRAKLHEPDATRGAPERRPRRAGTRQTNLQATPAAGNGTRAGAGARGSRSTSCASCAKRRARASRPPNCASRCTSWWRACAPRASARLRPPPDQPAEWRAGMRVRVRSLNTEGALAEPPRDGKAQVFIGKLRMEFPLSDLEPLPDAQQKPAPTRYSKPRPPQPVPLELDLHGKRVEEAQPLLEKYLDDAILAGLGSVRINHGRGTGTLRSVVHQYLKSHPQVRGFHLAPPHEGGDGVTVVRLK